ncbi:MAG: hypothetical protein B7Z10_11450 [Rhodobacterales bacterium 32-66-7]|nr:MAG: hypothetical protein B7Z31_05690 [Rhodobacterales bacterium 12-65-15]OYX23341.1 MAG: hypothetical protein B7Z10_11450 [Rhodobacterales bacterium 32-66-7]
MQILSQTRDRLVLEDNPVLLGCCLALAIFVPVAIGFAMLISGSLAGLWMLLVGGFFAALLAVFLRRVRVILDRTSGSLTIRTASLTGGTETSLPLADIRGVGVETSISRSTDGSGGVSHTYRTVLHLADRELPLSQSFSAGDGAQQAAQAIRDWLADGSGRGD